MTNNTVNNVPRELLCELRDAANEGMNATTRQHQIDHFAGLIAKADALLSAPSPAGVDGWDVASDILEKLSAAQAIIDGLRGENERIRLNIAEYNEAISCYQSERDQQAKRIGELEGLLREARLMTFVVNSGQSGVLRGQIDAALSAVCAAAPNIATTSEHSGS